jgi:hypothetical protein
MLNYKQKGRNEGNNVRRKSRVSEVNAVSDTLKKVSCRTCIFVIPAQCLFWGEAEPADEASSYIGWHGG